METSVNNKCKAFTSLEQSRKLAEILPLESADMLWGYYYNGKNHCIPNIRPFRDGRNEIPKCYIPAWSLAALLGVLPQGYSLGNKKNNGKYYICMTCVKHDVIEYDEPVNACVAMIEKLNELNLL